MRADRDHAPAIATDEQRNVPRRALLAGGVAVAGIALLKAEPAAASTGAMQYGAANDAGNSGTSLDSSAAAATLVATNSGSNGGGLYGGVLNAANPAHGVVGQTVGGGHAVLGQVDNPTSSNVAIAGSHNGVAAAANFVQSNAATDRAGAMGQTAGSGPGVVGFSYGTGIGVLGTSGTAAAGVKGTNSTSGPGVYGTNTSTGIGVWGASPLGRGGQFAGGKAQVRLVPSSDERPAVGKAGDLFVDQDHQLWYCRGGNKWTQLA
jgi:hypothetical protein